MESLTLRVHTHVPNDAGERGLARPLGASSALEMWAVLTLSEPLSQLHALPLLTYTGAWLKMFYPLRAIIRCM